VIKSLCVPLSSLLSTFQFDGRVKRFDNAPSTDVTNTGCPDGYIVKRVDNQDRCAACTKGTYANTKASPQECTACPFDHYSAGAANKECTACDTDKGTLQIGSDEPGDCIGKLLFINMMKYLAVACIKVNVKVFYS
jgi:hypothetical protein